MASPTIAYQGEPGAFSEQAAKAFFGRAVRLHPMETFGQVFEAATRGTSRYAIVPIENSVYGSIHQNYDLLLAHKLHIVGEVKLRIQLHLMAKPGVTLRQIRSVYSQPQALGQCEDFLRRLDGVEVVAFHDTAGAARMVRERNTPAVAAIASAQAARTYKLAILRRNVESNHHNYTRFIILSKRPVQARGNVKTSLVFATKNVPGALFRSLAVFALRDVNLLKIESRPLVGKPWEYLFYLDVKGSPDGEHLRQALSHLREVSTLVRVLGTYPEGKTIG